MKAGNSCIKIACSFRFVSWPELMSYPSTGTEHLAQTGPGIVAQSMGVRKRASREGEKVMAPSLLVLIKL